MKTLSTITVLLLLQSSSPVAQKMRYFIQSRMISFF